VSSTTLSLPALSGLRAAVVHDWLPVYGGAERVLEQMLHVLPEAALYSLLDFVPEDQRAFLGGRTVQTSMIQRLPLARRKYRTYLPLAPLAIEGFDLAEHDLVVSSSYVVAKGVLTTADQLHVSYVHSPVRYAWDLQEAYLRDGGYTRGLKGFMARALLHYLRLYDVASASRPDVLVANSRFVARRIWNTYRRRAFVIHPPVDVDAFEPCETKEGPYVTCARLVPYKRVDLLVEAFGHMPQRELVVIGDGPELGRLQAHAPTNVRFLGRQPHEALTYYLRHARGFLFAAIEDFGIAPVEAMACGTPVAAFGRGGALETVEEGVSGVLFHEQTAEAVCDAVERLERAPLEPGRIRAHAERFSAARFRAEFGALLEHVWARFEREGSGALYALAEGTPPPGRLLREEPPGGDGADAPLTLSL
jgi:glycosyltransferase involved in cell wall biosynthesis